MQTKRKWVQFTADASLTSDKGPHYEAGAHHLLRVDQADRWIKRGKAVECEPPGLAGEAEEAGAASTTPAGPADSANRDGAPEGADTPNSGLEPETAGGTENSAALAASQGSSGDAVSGQAKEEPKRTRKPRKPRNPQS